MRVGRERGLAQHGNQKNHASDLHDEAGARHAADSSI